MILALVILIAVLALVALALSALKPTSLGKKQPKTKKHVFELACRGWMARWMSKRGWGAVTIPGPWCVFILYWIGERMPEAYSVVRVHEFVHVAQDEKSCCFVSSWVKYLVELVWRRLHTDSWEAAYLVNRFEREAYAVETSVLDESTHMPEWA